MLVCRDGCTRLVSSVQARPRSASIHSPVPVKPVCPIVPGEHASLVNGPVDDVEGLLVVRSLTKTWSIAGLRAGHLVGGGGGQHQGGLEHLQRGAVQGVQGAARVAVPQRVHPRERLEDRGARSVEDQQRRHRVGDRAQDRGPVHLVLGAIEQITPRTDMTLDQRDMFDRVQAALRRSPAMLETVRRRLPAITAKVPRGFFAGDRWRNHFECGRQ